MVNRHAIALITAGALLSSCDTTTIAQKGKPLLPHRPLIQTSAAPPHHEPGEQMVWILPVFSSGYEPGHADPNTGEYVGGHEVTTIVEAGHYATQEEAELQGKPYLIPSTNQIVHPGLSQVTTLRRGSGEYEISLPQSKRIDPPTPKTQHSPSAEASPTPSKEPAKTAFPPLPGNSPAPTPASTIAPDPPPGFKVIKNAENEVVFSGGRPGKTYTVDTPKGQKVDIKYLKDSVQLTVAGNTRTISIRSPESQVLVRLPTTQ